MQKKLMEIFRLQDGEKQNINALRFDPKLHSLAPIEKSTEEGEEAGLRAKAKKAGIKSSHNKSLNKLRTELELLNQE